MKEVLEVCEGGGEFRVRKRGRWQTLAKRWHGYQENNIM
jgi:hypothetical protein